MGETMTGALERGRTAYLEQQWREAFAQLTAADRERPLEVDDLERLATAAHVIGDFDAKAGAFARAYNESLRAGDLKRAIGFAFWSGFGFGERGEFARAEGWLMRGFELVPKVDVKGVELGYLTMARAFRTLDTTGDIRAGHDLLAQAVKIAEAHGDASLAAMARHAQGRALIQLDRVAEGLALLDEAMVAVTSGEVSPLLVGNVYCGAIEGCKEAYDLRRAHEWTAALTRWFESQPDRVPYRGNCLVFRAELMRLHGAWPDAMEEAQRAQAAFGDSPLAASAIYQLGEGHRLRGEFDRADEAFRSASAAGHVPQPGLALLRLAQGKPDAASALLKRVLEEMPDPRVRARLLPAYVEVMLAAKDVATARGAAEEIAAHAASHPTDYLRGIAAQATASVRLAEGDAKGAVPLLREAWTAYRDVEAPYDGARVRELLGIAYQTLGDSESAEMEFDAARSVFEQLEAEPDAARVRARSQARGAGPSGLTARELEVLSLVAQGRTNRAIANELVISEKTVARHLSNIFDKLGVSSRSALTAYAYEHKLVGP